MASRKQGDVERVLRKARKLVERGWTKSGWFVERKRGVDCYCALGATNVAAGSEPWAFCAKAEAAAYLPSKEVGGDGRLLAAVTNFNDAQRTRKPVLALFDRAIARAQAEGV